MPVIDEQFAHAFGTEWCAAWTSNDLERILSHYTDDFEMASPYIAQMLPGATGGILKGKDAVRAYWKTGLERLPDLHFELIGTFSGSDAIALYYHGAQGKTVVEVLFFADDGRVRKATALYS